MIDTSYVVGWSGGVKAPEGRLFAPVRADFVGAHRRQRRCLADCRLPNPAGDDRITCVKYAPSYDSLHASCHAPIARGSVMTEIVLAITNKDGLHARPAKDFINKVREFKSKVTIQNLSRPDSKEVAVTPVGLLNIAARQGHQIRIRADGIDAAEAIAALKQLVESNFGE